MLLRGDRQDSGLPARVRGIRCPVRLADFDDWVVRTVLNSQSPLFREARYLLAEETEIRDPALYPLSSVPSPREPPTAASPACVRRKSAEITHPLNVLGDCALIAREPDLFRPARSTAGRRALINLRGDHAAGVVPAGIGARRGLSGGPGSQFLSRVVGPRWTSARSFALRRGLHLFWDTAW